MPPGFGLALDPDVRRPRPNLVVGGTPLRVLRLKEAGARMVDRWAAGEPVGPGPGAQALARRLLDAGIAHPRPPAEAAPADVGIVVPVRDDAPGLADTLAGVGATPVVVVDDGSDPPVGGAGIRHDGSRGPAAARNAGWRMTAGDIVVFLDAGCTPVRGWLDTLLPHFADPAVGAVAPRIVSSGHPDAPQWLADYDATHSSLDLGPREAPVSPGSRVPYVPTAALAVRRTALEEAGGFDDSLRYGEDVDLVWRLHDLGWRVRYEPAATVTHPCRPTLASWLRQRYHYGQSAAPLASRHGRAVAPLAINPWSALAWATAAAGFPVAAAAIAAGATAAIARTDRDAAPTLVRLAATGNLRAGWAIATAIRRAWLPPAVAITAVAWRNGRRAPAVALAVAVASAGPRRLADDLAYQTGVWSGVIRSRSGAALLPS